MMYIFKNEVVIIKDSVYLKGGGNRVPFRDADSILYLEYYFHGFLFYSYYMYFYACRHFIIKEVRSLFHIL